MNIWFEQKDSNLRVHINTEQKVEKPVLIFSCDLFLPVTAACMRDFLQEKLDNHMNELRKKMILTGYKLGRAKKAKPKDFSDSFSISKDWNECW